MRRHSLKALAGDSLPVMVPRNDKAAVPISLERVRRLRKHLVVTLRSLRTTKNPEHSVSPLRPEPEGFAAPWRAPPVLCARDGAVGTARILPFWMKRRWRVCAAQGRRWMCARCCGYMSSECRRLGSRIRAYSTENKVVRLTGRCAPMVCNNYFCSGLQGYMTGGDAVTPTMI